MFESKLPQNIKFCAINSSLGYDQILDPIEMEYLSTVSSKKRKTEYVLGRLAAREAILALGMCGKVTRDEVGKPVWPKGVVGSITHKNSWGMAITALKANYQSVGIDLEEINEGIRKIENKVCTDLEKKWIYENPLEFDQRLTSLFAAKEALFKCLNPISKKFFGFQDATCKWNETGFTATLNIELSAKFTEGSKIEIGISYKNNFVLAFVYI